MKQDSGGSTNPNTAGAKKVSVHRCLAITFVNIAMPTERQSPLTGDAFFLIMPRCNTVCMNIFLKKLSETYSEDIIVLYCDGAAWHKSEGLALPENIVLFHIPPYTPEMNPTEQIWKEIQKRGFRNEIFATLEKWLTVCAT